MANPAAHAGGAAPTADTPAVELWRFYLYFLRLGTIGFGGPIALAGFMQRDLVKAEPQLDNSFTLPRAAIDRRRVEMRRSI